MTTGADILAEELATRLAEACSERDALLAALKAEHAECPGYTVEPGHDCHGDEEACRRRCPIEERSKCPTCALIARAGGDRG